MSPAFEFPRLESPHVENPYPLYARARRQAPVFYAAPFWLWVISRYEHVLAALKDPKRFSSADTLSSPAPFPPEVAAVLAEGYPDVPRLVNDDPPSHTRVRTLVTKAFQSHRMTVPEVRAMCAELIDSFATQGHAELVSQLTHPLPLGVICHVLGIPLADTPAIRRWTEHSITLYFATNLPLADHVASARSFIEFHQYLAALINQRRTAPKADMITALIEARTNDSDTPLTMAELVHLIHMILFAGHETTTNLIGNALIQVLPRPDLWRALAKDPALAPRVIEETLRLDAPVQGMIRTTTEAVTLGGIEIPARAKVLLLFGSANRDEAVFAEPDRFDLDRPNHADHLGLGRGIHSCIGAALARTEAAIVLEELAKRLPELHLREGEPIAYLPNLLHRGPRALHVTWPVP